MAGADLSPYTNPYETQVVNQALADISGQQERALNQMGAQATAARAFGGSRQGVEAAETRKAYDEQAARTAATLRQGGFDRAIGAAQFDVGQRASAEAANVAARTGASQFGAQSMMDAQRQNVANRMAADSMRQGAGARLTLVRLWLHLGRLWLHLVQRQANPPQLKIIIRAYSVTYNPSLNYLNFSR